jgi:pantothenate kinase
MSLAPVQNQLSLTPDGAVAFVVDAALRLAEAHGGRVAIGLCGGPGVGKSTIAADVVAALNAQTPGYAAVVPMDGFHMRQAKLEALGTAFEKGAPHTFEGAAFADFLGDLRIATGAISGPGYSRKIEDVVEDAFTIDGGVRILVVEGNYLLLPDPPWDRIKPLLDLAVFIDLGRDKVLARLLARHNAEGLFTPDYSRKHVEAVDMANYDLVVRSRGRADVAIDLDTAR